MMVSMGGFLDSLGQIVLTHQAWSHYLIALGILLQGEVTVLVSVYLVINGSLGWLDFLVPAFLGILIGDYFLYFLGSRLRDTRFGWKMYKRLKQNKTAQFYTYYVSQNLKKIIVLSKFLIGTNFIAMLAVGWTKVKFRKFFKAHLLAVASWLFGITIVAYFLVGGVYLLKAEKVFKQVEIGIAVVLVIMIGGEVFLKRMLGKALSLESKAKDLGEKLNEKLEESNVSDDQEPEANRVKSGHAENIFKSDKNEDTADRSRDK